MRERIVQEPFRVGLPPVPGGYHPQMPCLVPLSRRIPGPILALVALLAMTACSRPPEGSLKELQTSQVGDLEVVLLAPAEALAQGQGFALIEFRDGNGMLVDVGTVRVTATMPMPGAPAMSGGSEIKPTPAPGRYEVVTDFSMAGTWYLQVEWNGPAGRGSAKLESRVM